MCFPKSESQFFTLATISCDMYPQKFWSWALVCRFVLSFDIFWTVCHPHGRCRTLGNTNRWPPPTWTTLPLLARSLPEADLCGLKGECFLARDMCAPWALVGNLSGKGIHAQWLWALVLYQSVHYSLSEWTEKSSMAHIQSLAGSPLAATNMSRISIKFSDMFFRNWILSVSAQLWKQDTEKMICFSRGL